MKDVQLDCAFTKKICICEVNNILDINALPIVNECPKQ